MCMCYYQSLYPSNTFQEVLIMFTKYNTEDYSQKELDDLNIELEGQLEGISDSYDREIIEKNFSDEIARR